MVAKLTVWHTSLTAALLCAAQIVWAEEPTNAANSTPTEQLSWQNLSNEQRQALIKRYQDLRQLPDTERVNLQQRMDWFSQLSKDKQQQMREVWQQMSSSEREQWKIRLQKASPEQREALREDIMQTYDKKLF